MRILHAVHDFLPRHRAGVEVHVADLCRALADRGHAPHVLCAEYDPARRHGALDWRWHDGVGVTEVVNNWQFADLAEATSSPRLGAVLGHVLDALRPDVLHLHSLFNLSFELPRLAAARGIPCVATLHDYTAVCPSGGKRVHRAERHLCREIEPERCARCFAQSPQRRQMAAARVARPGRLGRGVVALGRLARRRAPALLERVGRLAVGGPTAADREAIERRLASWRDDVVPYVERWVAPSAALAEEFLRLGVAADRIEVADYGIEPFPAVAVQRPRTPLVIGYVGSLTWEKGVHLLIAAAAELDPKSYQLHLFGEAPESDYESSLRRAAGGLPIRFHGGFDRDAVAGVYAAIDVLAVPSIWLENSPLVIHEAHHAGVPVVGSRLGGIEDLIGRQRDGVLFDPFAAGELTACLRRLIAEPERVEALARRLPATRTIAESAAEWERRYLGAVRRQPVASPTREARPRLGAVVLNYRTADETLLAVRSLRASRRPVDDVVVVDNGSADGSPELLAPRLAGARLLRNAGNLGFSAGVNVGIRACLDAGAERVLLLNSDALLREDAIDRLEAALDRDRAVGIASPTVLDAARPERVASRGLSFSPRSGRMRVLEHDAVYRPATGAAKVVDGASGCALLIEREVFDRVGLFEEEYFFSFEDLDFCLRARRAGFATVCAPDAVAYHHGSRSIGPRSPLRLYFAARNHLLLARRAAPRAAAMAALRGSWIVALNLAHALRGAAAPRAAGARQVLRGVGHHLIGRYRSGARSVGARGAPRGRGDAASSSSGRRATWRRCPAASRSAARRRRSSRSPPPARRLRAGW
jgi:GT2 family glycosyltransferase/glycosyltransferase involved in cell wall biosynthesis